MALIEPEMKFTLRMSPDGSKLLTFELDTNDAHYEGQRALSNACGSWGPWDLGLWCKMGAPGGHPTRRQAVELVGEDPVRWLEKGAKG